MMETVCPPESSIVICASGRNPRAEGPWRVACSRRLTQDGLQRPGREIHELRYMLWSGRSGSWNLERELDTGWTTVACETKTRHQSGRSPEVAAVWSTLGLTQPKRGQETLTRFHRPYPCRGAKDLDEESDV